MSMSDKEAAAFILKDWRDRVTNERKPLWARFIEHADKVVLVFWLAVLGVLAFAMLQPVPTGEAAARFCSEFCASANGAVENVGLSGSTVACSCEVSQ